VKRPAPDGRPSPHAASPEPADAAGHGAGPGTNADGRLLAALALLDELVQEREAAWKGLVGRLDGLRQEIAVASAQAQRSRPLAARKAGRSDDVDQARPSTPPRDEARAPRLMQEFEAALRETEKRRLTLHAEMDDLRRRGQDLLRRLPTPLSRAYRSLADAGRLPAIAAVARGACGGCDSPLPESVIEDLSRGAAAVCGRCERLLYLERHVD